MSEAEYQEYVRHVGNFAPLIRSGYFTKKFLIDAIQALLREDIPGGFCLKGNGGVKTVCQEKSPAIKTVNVMDMRETLAYIQDKSISVARFGDGEVDLMTGQSIPFQDYDEELAQRLKKNYYHARQ